jgi:hypothetical protein
LESLQNTDPNAKEICSVTLIKKAQLQEHYHAILYTTIRINIANMPSVWILGSGHQLQQQTLPSQHGSENHFR